jgi:protein-tyrosine phosphatase
MAGRDRTGLITMLLLALVGVEPEEIAADYRLSTERLAALYAHDGEEDQGPLLEAFLSGQGTSTREVMLGTLASLDLDAFVRAAGIADEDLAALRDRLI